MRRYVTLGLLAFFLAACEPLTEPRMPTDKDDGDSDGDGQSGAMTLALSRPPIPAPGFYLL